MDNETKDLIDELVGATPSQNPLYDVSLSTYDRVGIEVLKDFQKHGVNKMHYTQLMKHIGCNKITVYKVIKTLLNRNIVRKVSGGFYGLV